jgi:maltose O-acetyltransferase
MIKRNDAIIFKPIPKKNIFILLILFSRFLLLIPPFKFIITKYLRHCKNICFSPGFRFFYGNIYAKNVDFNDTFFLDYAPVYVGENSSFSFENIVITATHEMGDRQTVIAKPIHIGKNVWITTRCIILPGVKIGDNSVIAAGSVVTRDIPSNCLAGGNPARVIKKLNWAKMYGGKPPNFSFRIK